MTEASFNIRCPRCGQPTIYHTSNPFRPFCSEKCRLIDLGGWLEEAYRIPGQPIESEKGSRDEEGE